MVKGRRQVLHLPDAGDGFVGKALAGFLKALHGDDQIVNGTGQHPGKHQAQQHRRSQNKQCADEGNAHDLPQGVGNQLLKRADAYDPPDAVFQRLDGVDGAPLHVRPVRERGRQVGILAFQLGIDELLLGVVNEVSLRVLKEAVAPLADAHAADIGGNIGAAHVHGDVPLPLPGKGRADDGHDPWVVLHKNRHDVGRGYIAALIKLPLVRVKGKVLQDIFPQTAAKAVAVAHFPLRVVGGDGHHVGANFQKRLEPRFPFLRRQLQVAGQQRHRVVHVLQVFVHGAAGLGDGLTAGGLGVAQQRLTVGLHKDQIGAQQHAHRNRRERERHDKIHAETLFLHTSASFCS